MPFPYCDVRGGGGTTPGFASTPIQSALAWCSTILPSTILSISYTLHINY